MNYRNPELRALLAGEYVLGSLHGGARRRFEQLLQSDPQLRAEVSAWEARFAPLDQAIEPVTPPTAVWKHIQQRLGHAEDTVPEKPGWFARLALWRGLTAVTSLATLVLAVLLLLPPSEQVIPFRADYVAVVNDAEQRPLWLLRADSRNSRLRLEPLWVPAPPSGKTYELWLLAEDGVPRSLGLLPQTTGEEVERGFEVALAGEFPAASGIAVSLEPSGGSPTGLPTGPVLYQAELMGGAG